jgi:hypothetical protein
MSNYSAGLDEPTGAGAVRGRLNRMSWSAILAGVVIALIVQMLLSMLGFGLGLAAMDPAGGGSPTATTSSMTAGVWWIVSGIIASAAGGYVAGRACGATQLTVGLLHGLTSWAAATLVIVYLLTTVVGGLVGGALSTVTSALSGAGSSIATGVQSVAPAAANVPDPFGKIENGIRSASGGEDPAALRDKAIYAVKAVMTGDPAQQEQAKTTAAEALAKAQNIPVDQARTQIDRYQAEFKQTADQARQQATQAADTAAKAGSVGALVAFFALVLGAVAAAVAGRMGVAGLRGW